MKLQIYTSILIFLIFIHHSSFCSEVIFRVESYKGECILIMMKGKASKSSQPNRNFFYIATGDTDYNISQTLYYKLIQIPPNSSTQWQNKNKLNHNWKIFTNGESYNSCEDVIQNNPHSKTKYYV